MTRLIVFAVSALCLAACSSSPVEVSCGVAACASNQRCEPSQQVCVLDEPPTLVIDTPSAGALVAGDTLILKGSVQDDGGAATLELSTDSEQSWLKVPLKANHFEVRIALPVLDAQPFVLGLRAHDSHQQATTAQVKVVVDNVAPQLTMGGPLAGAKLNAAWFAGAAAVSGLAIDGSNALTVTVDVGGGASPVPVNGGHFSHPWAAPPGEDGVTHALRITAVDPAGNVTTLDESVQVDVVPPSVSFVTPVANALLGTAFFQGGGLLQGAVSPGATVTAQLGNLSRPATVNGGQWSLGYPTPSGIDFQPQVLELIATDAAGNVSHARQVVTVDVVPPVLVFGTPTAGARFNAASFVGTDDVAVSFVVSDGDAQVVVRDGTAVVTSNPLKVRTSPSDNPRNYVVRLTASDRAGNTTTSAIHFAVDRVLPAVVTRVPLDGTRNNGALASVEFSEPVTGGDGITLSPAVSGGGWLSPTHYEIPALPADTAFSSSVGAVTDAFGNPATPGTTAHFHTAPRLPASGAALMDDVWHFKAAVDPDGVLSVFTTSQTSPAGYRWVRVNPKTGLVEDNRPPWLPTLGSGFSELDTYSWSHPNADLSARRVVGAMTLHPGVILERRVWARFDEGTANTALGMVGLIPTPAFAGEGALGEAGNLEFVSSTDSRYIRSGLSSSVDLGLAAPTGIGYGDRRWELIEVRNQTFKRRSYGCSRQYANAPLVCTLTPLAQWNDVASTDNTSYAMGDGCSVAIYDTSAGSRVMRIEPYAPSCLFSCPVASSASRPLSTELRIAIDRRETNTFIGADRTPTGVQLKRLALGSACSGAFVNVGAPVPVPPGAAFEPISLGGKAALLYVDTGNILKVVVK